MSSRKDDMSAKHVKCAVVPKRLTGDQLEDMVQTKGLILEKTSQLSNLK